MAKKRKPQRQPGIGVDAFGGTTIDPTANVIALTEAANKRQDDLRAAESRRVDEQAALRAAYEEKLRTAESRRIDEQANLRAEYEDKLRTAEAQRLDSIRQVDREDVNKTAAQALTAIQTLAATTNTTAETLRNQAATAAQQAAQQRANDTTEFNKRLSAVELALSEGKGKQTVADPMMAELVVKMEKMSGAMTGITGQSQGAKNLWGYIVAGAALIAALIAIAKFVG